MEVKHEKLNELHKETAERIERMNEEFAKEPKIKTFDNDENYDQMIIQKDIPFMALCEHHEVAFMGTISLAYIPKDKLIGLSKLARISEYYANPTVKTLQERITQQIADKLDEILKPKGVAVLVKANHGCMCYRGVKKPSETITSALKGVFLEETRTRQEFMELIR